MILLHFLAAASAISLAGGQATSCLKHDHCPEHSVCVTEDAVKSPKCFCLVGYRYNGISCVENTPGNLDAQAQAVLGAESQKIVVERCSGASDGDEPASPDPDAGAASVKLRPNQPAKTSEATSGSGAGSEDEATTLKVPCSPVECDFSNGPCSYQNDYYSEWQLREIEGGTILLSTGDAKTEHYLLSAPFRVREPSLLLFDYFESSLGPSHLAVYSRDLATLIWKPSGKEAGWQQAVATLAPGKHQIIFAAEKLKPSELAAVTNIRLVGATGSPAGCY